MVLEGFGLIDCIFLQHYFLSEIFFGVCFACRGSSGRVRSPAARYRWSKHRLDGSLRFGKDPRATVFLKHSEAILFGRSRMDPKVAVLKPLSSAISIGTGGPFGAEGPIIMTGGAVGSLVAQMFHLSAAGKKDTPGRRSRRRYVCDLCFACGCCFTSG